MEGECKIKEIYLLRFNYLKSIFFGVLLTVSIVGLLLLKYFQKMRVIVFYDSLEESQKGSVTHVYIKGQENSEEISKVKRIKHQ